MTVGGDGERRRAQMVETSEHALVVVVEYDEADAPSGSLLAILVLQALPQASLTLSVDPVTTSSAQVEVSQQGDSGDALETLGAIQEALSAEGLAVSNFAAKFPPAPPPPSPPSPPPPPE